MQREDTSSSSYTLTIGNVQFTIPRTGNARSLLEEMSRKCQVLLKYATRPHAQGFESSVDVSEMLGFPPGSVYGVGLGTNKKEAEKVAAEDAVTKLTAQERYLRFARPEASAPSKPGVTLLKEWCDENRVVFAKPEAKASGLGFVATMEAYGRLFSSDVCGSKKLAEHAVCKLIYDHVISQPRRPALGPSSSPVRALSPPAERSPVRAPIIGAQAWARESDVRRDDYDDEGEVEPTPAAASLGEKAKRKATNKAAEGHVEVMEPLLLGSPKRDRQSDDHHLPGQTSERATPPPSPTPTATPRFPMLFEMLKKHGIESLYPHFDEQNIDYDQLMELTEDEWVKFLNADGVKMGDRKRLQTLYQGRVKMHEVKVGKRQLGEGRSSEVFEGFMDQQRVALKDYKRGISARERKVLETTKHPNVVHCYGVGVDKSKKSYLVFEKLHSNLNDFLLKERQSLTQLIRILKKVAKGMAYLHSMDYVHCDLAGRNILVSADLHDIKIADFELTKLLEDNKSYYKGHFATVQPLCSAPEFQKDDRLTKRSDVWSFGMLCWAVFHYDEEIDEEEISRQIRQESFHRDFLNSAQFSMVTREIRELFAQCLDYDHTKRPEFDLIYRQLKEEQKRCEQASEHDGDVGDDGDDYGKEEEEDGDEEDEDDEEEEEEHKSNYRPTSS